MEHFQPLADAELISLSARGEVGAFQVLYRRHAAAVVSLAYRITRNETVARDVARDALLEIWRDAGRYREERRSVRTWMLAITREKAIGAAARGDGRAAPEPDEAEVAQRSGTDRPSSESRAIELAYFGGLSVEEISGSLDLPPETVKAHLRRGLEAMLRSEELGGS